MATITGVYTPTGHPRSIKLRWETLTESNTTGTAESITDFTDRSVQVIGTFGGSTVSLQGSNDGGTTWAILDDPQGTAISLTSAGIAQIGTITELIRPIVVGGTSVDVDVHVYGRANTR